MLVNRCDCCGKETATVSKITFGCDVLFVKADYSEVCHGCYKRLFEKSREFRTKFINKEAELLSEEAEPSEVSNE